MKWKVYLATGKEESVEADQMSIGDGILTFYKENKNKVVAVFNRRLWTQVLKDN